MATHVVVREFKGPDGMVFRSGQQVDAGNWQNLRSLISARYLRDRTATEVQREQTTRPIRGKG